MDPSMIKDPALTLQLALKQQQQSNKQSLPGMVSPVDAQLLNLPILGNDLFLVQQRIVQQQLLLQQM